ncbi:translation initiation factor eIF3 subunit [Ascosphaera pollenicola]|nr:translation initiation factor eIF3 subunit [Ascosphaera pollenicola]
MLPPQQQQPLYPIISDMSGITTSAGQNMYPTVSGVGPASTLSSVFDADERRRFSGGMLQRARRVDKGDKADTAAATSKGEDVVDPAMKGNVEEKENVEMQSQSGQSNGQPQHQQMEDREKTPSAAQPEHTQRDRSATPTAAAPAAAAAANDKQAQATGSVTASDGQRMSMEQWIANVRLLESIRQYVRGRLEHGDFEEEQAQQQQQPQPQTTAADTPTQVTSSAQPVTRDSNRDVNVDASEADTQQQDTLRLQEHQQSQQRQQPSTPVRLASPSNQSQSGISDRMEGLEMGMALVARHNAEQEQARQERERQQQQHHQQQPPTQQPSEQQTDARSGDLDMMNMNVDGAGDSRDGAKKEKQEQQELESQPRGDELYPVLKMDLE